MEENKSSLNPQVQQLQVSQPLAQLLFKSLGFPSTSILLSFFCTSLNLLGGLASVLNSVHPFKTFGYHAKKSPLPTFSPSECLEYQPLTLVVGFEGVGLPVNPSAQWRASKMIRITHTEVKYHFLYEIQHISFSWTSLILYFSFITHFRIYTVISQLFAYLCIAEPLSWSVQLALTLVQHGSIFSEDFLSISQFHLSLMPLVLSLPGHNSILI